MEQRALARQLGIHRVTLHGWEKPDSMVDAIRAARYERALRELVAEAIDQDGAA